MPRARSKRTDSPPPTPPVGSALLQADLGAWAGEGIAQAGRREALLGRVERLRVLSDGRSIEARVRGNRTLPYQVRVWTRGDELSSRCTCAKAAERVCKHAVAAMEALRFPIVRQAATPPRAGARAAKSPRRDGGPVDRVPGVSGYLVVGGPERLSTREDRLAAGREEELSLRRQRSRRRRAEVTALAGDAGVARFAVSNGKDGPVYLVALRGEGCRLASCTCADFAASELRECEHTVRARSWFKRRRGRCDAVPRLSAWWRPRDWIEHSPDTLREIRVDAPDAAGRPAELAEQFDAEGWLEQAPEGHDPVDWVREALDRAREVARSRGWSWDLDEQVLRRIEAVEQERIERARTASLDTKAAEWVRVRDQLRLKLHAYQETGALFLARRGRAFLADDMGLGKTVQAVAAALLLRERIGVRKFLVVCPASLKHQWRREIDKVSGESATVIEGAKSRRLEAYQAWSEGFLILNYELVLRDLDSILASRPDIVILDEAQRIKNWETKTARAVKRLDSPHAFVLTGTPLENRLVELHSLVEFLHPRGLGPRWRMLPFHAVTDPRGRVLAYEGLHVLRKRLGGFFLRRERSNVLDQLPERTDNTFWTGMTIAQRRPYRRHAGKLASLLTKGGPLPPGDVRSLLRALTSMRVLCNSLAQHDWERWVDRLREPEPAAFREIRALGSPKLEEFSRVLDDLLEESDTKIVVFSEWERALRLAHFVVREQLANRDLRAEVFHGGLTSRARSKILDAFCLDPEFRVLFSTDAGGQGLNLQEAASIVVNLEVPWNPAVLEQRIGRVHRIGQRRSVQVLHFVTSGAVEERVRQVVEDKRMLFEGLLVHGVDKLVFDSGTRSTFTERLASLIEPERLDED